MSDLRERARLSRRQLSALAGLSANLVAQIEASSPPGVAAKTLDAIAQVFGATLDWLYAGRGEAPADVLVSRKAKAAARASRARAAGNRA